MKKTIASFIAFVIAFLSPIPSYAGYAQLKFPPGYSSPKTIGSSGTFKSGTAANDTVYKGSTVLTNAALDIGGQFVTVPVGLRIAANAGTLAAAYSFGNPAVFAGVAAAAAVALLYDHYKINGLTVEEGVWKAKDPNICTVGPCYEYNATDGRVDGYWTSSAPSACQAYASKTSAQTGYPYTFNGMFAPDQCRIGYPGGEFGQGVAKREVPVQAPVLKPATVVDFERLIASQPLPTGWPKSIPEFDVPVEQPSIWPYEIPTTNPTPIGQPETNPAPRWVPTGDPVKNPNSEPGVKPDTWTQPGKDIKPAATPTDPWRVDVTDNPKTKTDPSPNTTTATPTTTTPTPTDFQTCGLPGKPKCAIDETGTKADKGDTLTAPKTALDATENARKASIDSAQQIQRPEWTFTFQLPSGCTPFITGLKGVVLDVCRYREPIHDLLSMVWAGATVFCLAGMVGRTIRES